MVAGAEAGDTTAEGATTGNGAAEKGGKRRGEIMKNNTLQTAEKNGSPPKLREA
jgi:hypothetical protein